MEETLTKTNEETRLEPPKNWKVVLFNDDVTPFMYVVTVMHLVFRLEPVDAIGITSKAQEDGSCVIGVYPKSIAESKIMQVESMNKMSGYSLKITMEEE